VRRAQAGKDLAALHAAVAQEFLQLDTDEQNARAVMSKMETGFLRRFASFAHD
jgi:F-type H+-transporting ATPase subunit epsilon